MSQADDIRRELADINRQLAELPAEDYSTRIDLRERRDGLRAEVAHRAHAGTPTAELEADLRLLRKEHEQLVSRRLSSAHVGGGGGPGGGGFEPVVLANLNADIDKASGVHDVEELIRQLERELEARRSIES